MDKVQKQLLIEGWFLGTLSHEGAQDLEKSLLQNRSLRDEFRMAAKVDTLLRTKADEDASASKVNKHNPRKTTRNIRFSSSKTIHIERRKKSNAVIIYPLSVALSVAALLIISFIVFTPKQAPQKLLRIAHVSGESGIYINGKVYKSVDSVIHSGDTVSVPQGTKIKLKYENENTSIELYESSEAKFSEEKGNKKIYLSRGELKGEVAKQVSGKRMSLQTAHSNATVLGTVFSLKATHKSRLEVYEGKVQFESLLSGKKVYVSGGYFSEAGEGIFTDTHPLKINFPIVKGKVILYVGGQHDLSPQNSILKRLSDKGFRIKTISDTDWRLGHTQDVDLIIVSASATDGNLDKGINKVDTPIISWHSSIFDNLGLVKAKDLNSGFTQNKSNGTSGTEIQMTNLDHPLSAGLNGHVTLFNTEGNNISWGVPSHESASIIATVGTQSRPAIFAFDKGQQMRGKPAPARRVALCYGESTRYLDTWTSNAWRLLDVAVLWALELDSQ